MIWFVQNIFICFQISMRHFWLDMRWHFTLMAPKHRVRLCRTFCTSCPWIHIIRINFSKRYLKISLNTMEIWRLKDFKRWIISKQFCWKHYVNIRHWIQWQRFAPNHIRYQRLMGNLKRSQFSQAPSFPFPYSEFTGLYKINFNILFQLNLNEFYSAQNLEIRNTIQILKNSCQRDLVPKSNAIAIKAPFWALEKDHALVWACNSQLHSWKSVWCTLFEISTSKYHQNKSQFHLNRIRFSLIQKKAFEFNLNLAIENRVEDNDSNCKFFYILNKTPEMFFEIFSFVFFFAIYYPFNQLSWPRIATFQSSKP